MKPIKNVMKPTNNVTERVCFIYLIPNPNIIYFCDAVS